MRSDYAPGRDFPDFVLPDDTYTEQRLSALQGDDPMLLVLIRSLGCPKDRDQLDALTRFHPRLVQSGCRLVVITADDWRTTAALRHELGAEYPLLHDEDRRVCDTLDIVLCTDSEHRPVIPHTFLLAPRLKIRKVWNGNRHWGRPSTCELHDALCEVARDLRAGTDRACPAALARGHREGGEQAAWRP